MADGRQVGVLPDGSVLNEMGYEVNIYNLPKNDESGEYEWLFLLPDINFDVKIHGQSEGEFHAYLGTVQGVYQFAAQAISEGDEVTFEVDVKDGPSEMLFENGTTVKPVLLSLNDSEQESENSNENDQSLENSSDNLDDSSWDWSQTIYIVAGICLFVIVSAGIFYAVVKYRKKKGKTD